MFQQLSYWQTYLDLSISERTKTDLQQKLWGHTTNKKGIGSSKGRRSNLNLRSLVHWYITWIPVNNTHLKYSRLISWRRGSPSAMNVGWGTWLITWRRGGQRPMPYPWAGGAPTWLPWEKEGYFLINCQHIIVLHFKIDPWSNFSLVHKIWTKFIENMI